jgi:hypothetical protein
MNLQVMTKEDAAAWTTQVAKETLPLSQCCGSLLSCFILLERTISRNNEHYYGTKSSGTVVGAS